MFVRRRRSVESYGHKAAITACTSWLRTMASKVSPGEYVIALDEIGWQLNRKGPHWGVWNEYPFGSINSEADITGIDPTWDDIDVRWADCPPTPQELTKMHGWPIHIADIAIQDRGMIQYVIEITYSNPLSQEKIDWYWNAGIKRVIEIPAEWVLSQVEPPRYLPPEFWRYGKAMQIPIFERKSVAQASAPLRMISS